MNKKPFLQEGFFYNNTTPTTYTIDLVINNFFKTGGFEKAK
ncbi:hypothetical protein CHCC20372_1023 [Bacillus paralicheniformis]|nr:hypothetical protein CHCC20372_1023 [Bacillus paralicheniformis]